MKRKCLLNILTSVSAIALTGLVMGCTEKDLYDPNYGKEPLPDPSEYFGFEMRDYVNLSVNYNAPGFTTLIEVYGEDPMETVDGTPVKKAGVEALFKIYTDDNGKYEGKMNIPTSINTVYLYTATWGLPRCIKREIKDGIVSFDMSPKQQSNPSQTRSTATRSYTFNGNVPYKINGNANLYSLCKWSDFGRIQGDDYYSWPSVPLNPGYVTNVGTTGNERTSDFATRMMKIFCPNGDGNIDNSGLVRESQTTNITIKQDNTTLDVVFVNRDAAYNNTFGYYYYKTGENVDKSTVKKYIIFPNVCQIPPGEGMEIFGSILTCGDKISLLYFPPSGGSTDKFPAGYTVGWFIYSDGYIYNPMSSSTQNSDEINLSKPLYASNINGEETQHFISVKDDTSGKVIIGVEDGGNKSYCDLLFYVDASPIESIEDPNRPNTDPDAGKNDPVIPATESHTGTLAFEDIWPSGGDYDMNDVVVEYNRTIAFDKKNMVSQIVDVFKPVYDGATYKNAFAYQIDSDQFGDVTSNDGIEIENKTSSIIVLPNAKESIGKTYTITRTFAETNSFKKDDLKEYNPYIIVKYIEGQAKRTEVHLPKHNATSLVDPALIGSSKDAYYIDREGAYPFAIDIPKLDFIPVTESHHIDTEYPDFAKWAKSKGTEYTEWYNNYIGSK